MTIAFLTIKGKYCFTLPVEIVHNGEHYVLYNMYDGDYLFELDKSVKDLNSNPIFEDRFINVSK